MQNNNGIKTFSIYIHLPFCKKKCDYCDFYSLPSDQYDNDIIYKCLAAIKQHKQIFSPQINIHTVNTMYFGGGTPSVLDIAQLEKLFLIFPETYESFENTVEINPETITEEKLALFKTFGINRVSIGIQTFSKQGLEFLGRAVSLKSIYKALQLIKKHNFSISCDLLLGIPYSNLEEDLTVLITLNPEHISCYMLTLYKNTPLGQRLKTNEYDDVEAKAAHDYLKTLHILKDSGYEHYEISNFKKKGTNGSLHNYAYWNRKNYIGLGPSASSFLNPYRWKNQDCTEYIYFWEERNKRYRKNKNDSFVFSFLKEIDADMECLSGSEAIIETIMLSLRLQEGLSCELLIKSFNYDIIKAKEKEIQCLIDENKLMYANKKLFIPSEKMLHFNSIVSELL